MLCSSRACLWIYLLINFDVSSSKERCVHVPKFFRTSTPVAPPLTSSAFCCRRRPSFLLELSSRLWRVPHCLWGRHLLLPLRRGPYGRLRWYGYHQLRHRGRVSLHARMHRVMCKNGNGARANWWSYKFVHVAANEDTAIFSGHPSQCSPNLLISIIVFFLPAYLCRHCSFPCMLCLGRKQRGLRDYRQCCRSRR